MRDEFELKFSQRLSKMYTASPEAILQSLKEMRQGDRYNGRGFVSLTTMTMATQATLAWWAWKAALDSVEIDLSEHHGGQAIPGSERMFLSDVRAAIEAAGLKVKP